MDLNSDEESGSDDEESELDSHMAPPVPAAATTIPRSKDPMAAYEADISDDVLASIPIPPPSTPVRAPPPAAARVASPPPAAATPATALAARAAADVPPPSVSPPATSRKRPCRGFVISSDDEDEAEDDGDEVAAMSASPAAAVQPDLLKEEGKEADEEQDEDAQPEAKEEAEEEEEDDDDDDDDEQEEEEDDDDDEAEDEAAVACNSQNSEDMHTSSQPTLHEFLSITKRTTACKDMIIRRADRGDRVVLSLFDHSTIALRDWCQAGYTCIAFDQKHPEGETRDQETGILCRGVDLYDEDVLDRIEEEFRHRACFVSAFPPCTNFSQAGRRTWDKKRKLNPNFQNDDADRFQRLRERLNRWGVRYYMENPDTGKLKQLLTHSDHAFHPNQYGKYLKSDDVHPLAKYPPRDAYEKGTGLWVGGGFKMPERRSVKPDKSFSVEQLQSKDRSHTPRGFARAVCLANYGSCC